MAVRYYSGGRLLESYSLDEIIHFGKYSFDKNKQNKIFTLREIIGFDPSYVEWCLLKVGFFSIDNENFARVKKEFPNFKISERAEEARKHKNGKLENMADDAHMEDMSSYDAYEGDYMSWLGDND